MDGYYDRFLQGTCPSDRLFSAVLSNKGMADARRGMESVIELLDQALSRTPYFWPVLVNALAAASVLCDQVALGTAMAKVREAALNSLTESDLAKLIGKIKTDEDLIWARHQQHFPRFRAELAQRQNDLKESKPIGEAA